MPASALAPPPGSAASGGFSRRASRVVSNAGLYQLVEDMAGAVDRLCVEFGGMRDDIAIIKTLLIERLDGSK